MLDLRKRGPDVRRFVATLEEWIIRTLARFNVRGERREDRSGVGVDRPDKGDGVADRFAARGSRGEQWVTLHGMACNGGPGVWQGAGGVACGGSAQRDGVTSLADLGIPVSMPVVDIALKATFAELFGAGDQIVGSTVKPSAEPPISRSAASPSR
jgi:lipoyl(octanoyl) transferase